MAGRPNIVERTLLEYLGSRPEPVLDLSIDGDPLRRQLAAATGRPNPDLEGAIRRLRKKGHLHLLQRGRYVASQRPQRSPRLWANDPVAAAVMRRLGDEYFVSWHAALWFHGLIDQQSRRISVAVRKQKRPVRLSGGRLEFVVLTERKFFGFKEVDDLDWPVKMASVSKALLDALDRPDLVGPPIVIIDALRRAARTHQGLGEDLVADALRTESPTLNRRLGFLMQVLGIEGWEPLELRLGRGYAEPLFPGGATDRLPVDRRWRVYRDDALVASALEIK